MSIPYPPTIPHEHRYQNLLDDAVSSHIPYAMTVPVPDGETPYPVWFPGQSMYGIPPAADIPICPPENFLPKM